MRFKWLLKAKKRHKSPGTDQIPEELIKVWYNNSLIKPKSINSIWNKEETFEEWKESITLPPYKEGDKTECSNYKYFSTTYKILSNILLSMSTPYAEEIIGDYQCGFRRNRSTTDYIFCIRHILEKNRNAIKQLFVNLKNAYDSIEREVLYILSWSLVSPRNW